MVAKRQEHNITTYSSLIAAADRAVGGRPDHMGPHARGPVSPQPACLQFCHQLLRSRSAVMLCCSVLCKYTYGHFLSSQVCSHSTPMHCNTAFGRLHLPLLSAALQHRLTAALSHCKYPYSHLLSIQVCSHSTPMHCNTDSGKLQHPLLSDALQYRLTAAVSQSKYTYGHFLSSQVQLQCTATLILANCNTHCSVLLCNTG